MQIDNIINCMCNQSNKRAKLIWIHYGLWSERKRIHRKADRQIAVGQVSWESLWAMRCGTLAPKKKTMNKIQLKWIYQMAKSRPNVPAQGLNTQGKCTAKPIHGKWTDRIEDTESIRFVRSPNANRNWVQSVCRRPSEPLIIINNVSGNCTNARWSHTKKRKQFFSTILPSTV